jgi:hypothetical protein
MAVAQFHQHPNLKAYFPKTHSNIARLKILRQWPRGMSFSEMWLVWILLHSIFNILLHKLKERGHICLCLYFSTHWGSHWTSQKNTGLPYLCSCTEILRLRLMCKTVTTSASAWEQNRRFKDQKWWTEFAECRKAEDTAVLHVETAVDKN